MNRYYICAAANSKYLRYLYVMLLSLFRNNQDIKLDVYVLERDLDERDKEYLNQLAVSYGQFVHCIHVDETEFTKLPTTNRYSLETYFRFKIPELLPKSINRVLYLDVDIIVNDSISDLLELDMGDYYFAACKDMMEPQLIPKKQGLFGRYEDLRYFNAGVMMWNLKEIRKTIHFSDFIEAGEQLGFDLPCVDQDILNYLYYSKTKYLEPETYNYLMLYDLDHESKMKQAKIVHFNWFAPWQAGAKAPGYQLWWKYAKMSPFYEELLTEQLERMETYTYDNYRKNISGSALELGIYRKLYHLKGRGILKNYFGDNKHGIAIYGAGNMAEALFELFQADLCQEYLLDVFDNNKQGKFHGLEIKEFDATFPIRGNLVVTPLKDSSRIIEKITAGVRMDSVYTLDVFLEKVMEYAEGL